MKKSYDSRLKKRLKCSNCTRKLNNSVFQVCLCRRLFCPLCASKKNHNCIHYKPPGQPPGKGETSQYRLQQHETPRTKTKTTTKVDCTHQAEHMNSNTLIKPNVT